MTRYSYSWWQRLNLALCAASFWFFMLHVFSRGMTLARPLGPGAMAGGVVVLLLAVALLVHGRIGPYTTVCLAYLVPLLAYLVWFVAGGHGLYVNDAGEIPPPARLLDLLFLTVNLIRAFQVAGQVHDAQANTQGTLHGRP